MPSLIQTILSVLESHQISRMQRVADYTAGRESHPAPKNLFICFSHLKLSQITMDVNCKDAVFVAFFTILLIIDIDACLGHNLTYKRHI